MEEKSKQDDNHSGEHDPSTDSPSSDDKSLIVEEKLAYKKLPKIPSLKVIHFSLLIIIFLFYSLLRINSEPHDLIIITLDNFLVIITTVWTIIVFILICSVKDKNNYKNNLVKLYNNFLDFRIYLIISNFILFVVFFILLYQLIMFRQVVFYTDKNVSISLNDDIKKNQFIGNISQNIIIKYRLHIGNRKIIFRDNLDNEIVHAEEIKVKPIWIEITPIIVNKKLEMRKKYESVK